MLNSPLFVSGHESDSSSDDDSEFDDENYDNDNDNLSINSDEIVSPEEYIRPLSPDIQISDGKEIVGFVVDENKETVWSTDPFAPNYRKRADWDAGLKQSWENEWGFVRDVVEKFESVEHAEFTRPFDQMRVLLQQRGLHEKYEELWNAPDPITRSCDIMNMLLEEAPDLIVRYAELEQLTKQRIIAAEKGEKQSWEVAWTKRRRAELGPWGTPMLR